jgi:citrate lyase subunit beta/citryl-CoA lyase
MPKYIRRSIFSLSIEDPMLGKKAFDSWADAIILNFAKTPGRNWQDDVTSCMPAAIDQASAGGAEVFVRINSAAAAAELEASVFPGIVGVVLTEVNGPDEVKAASQCLERLEQSRGIAAGALEIDVEINTAAGVWNSIEIARASPRFGTFAVDENELYRNLGMFPEPELEFEPIEYIKSQLITVATSVGGQAQGLSYPLSLTQEDAGEAELRKAVRRARDTGFKGALCPHASWIQVCNAGFRPSPEEVAYYRKVREVFAEGLQRGMASVPIDGKMIDIPVDLRAKVYLEWAVRASARDADKANAHQEVAA